MFNTLKYTKDLEEAGIPRKQAEAQVLMMADFVDQNIATKVDLNNLRYEIKGDISELRQEMVQYQNDLSHLESRLTLKLGTMMSIGIAALAALIKFS